METLIKQICVLILLQDIDNKAPSYVEEKMYYLNPKLDVLTVVQALDRGNLVKLRDYLDHWNVEISGELDALLRQNGV
jgi:hypothetical protein